MARSETILFIRHAEKPDDVVRGVREDGGRDPEALTARGWQRAGALAVLFGRGTPLPVPNAIFAAGPSDEDPSQRPLQTVTPLARKLGIEVRSNYTKIAFADMLAEVTRTAGVSLVSWEHKVLAQSLASPTPGIAIEGQIPRTWPDDRFDIVWMLRRTAGDTYSFTQIPQLLLDGDSPEPIRLS